MVSRGCTEIITGMARGWDLKVARAAADAGVPYVAAIPYPGHYLKWSEADQTDYCWARDRATRTHIAGMLPLNIHFIQRDQWIVDQSEELWALDSGRRSGSHTTVLYAEKVGRIVRPLWEPWLRFRAERN